MPFTKNSAYRLNAGGLSMKKLILFISLISLLPVACFALDLDDGIAIDDSIDDYHELGTIQKNISYVIMNSLSKAYRSLETDDYIQGQGTNSSSPAGTAGISAVNSIIVATGGIVEGDIIIIDESDGGHTAISQ